MKVDPARLDEVFEGAIAETAPEDRSAYLDLACGDDRNLRHRVEQLLSAYNQAGSLLALAEDDATSAFVSVSERVGGIIGRYTLLEQVGEGGFGVVFMAEQEQPVRRRVALKIIKLGMDTKQVVARFEAERQALAMMDHPHIAKIFDAGSTETGRPYFVMELVRGVPITQYCDRACLTADQRLGLFQSVCAAVQHAHQKGIIHRDLKPSNVLVTLHDDKAVPKVIDFGVAKATQARLTERTLFTEFRQMIGTPTYMSPEQALMSGLDVDTCSDIYSLGVLLYELLTGSTPIDLKQLTSASYDDMRRLICEVEPPKPSARLSTFTRETLTTIAHLRHCDPAKLTISLRSDLDWIVMKCLEKDRSRRYESASALALDLQRYLDGQPVEARPPSSGYRLRKFVRRHRRTVMAGGLTAAALLAGIAIATWQAIRATRAEKVAVAAATAEAAAKEAAEERQAEMQVVLDFVESKVFAASRPEGQDGGLGRDVTLRAAIESALPFVETSFAQQPLIEARLRRTLGQSFLYLGKAHTAEEQFQAARDIYMEQLGAEHPDTLASTHELARCYYILGRHVKAVKLSEENLVLRKAVLGPGHPDTIDSMLNLARGYEAFVRSAEALALREETVLLRKAMVGSDHPTTIDSMLDLAGSYFNLARYDEALKLLEETLAAAKATFGPDHSTTILSMIDLANSYRAIGRRDDALQLHQEALALAKAKLGPGHPITFHGMSSLADSYAALGRIADVESLLTGDLLSAEEDLPQYVGMLQFRGDLQARLGRWPEAAADLLKLTEVEPDRYWTYFQISSLLAQIGDDTAYHDHCGRILRRFSRTEDPYIAERIVKFCLILPWSTGDLQAFSDLADAALAVDLAHDGLPFFEFAKGLVEFRLGNFAAAAVRMEKVLEAPGWVPFRHAQAYMVLAMTQLKMNQFEKAGAAFDQGSEYIRAHIPKLDTDYFGSNSWPDVIIVYALQCEAIALADEMLFRREAALGPDHADVIKAQRDLAVVFESSDYIDKAEALLTDGLLATEEYQPRYPYWLGRRGYLRGRLGRWREATDDYLRLVKLRPNSSWDSVHLAPLLVQIGDPAAYHNHCAQMLRRFADTDDHGIAHRTAKFSLILPWPEADFQVLSKLADFALAAGPTHEEMPLFQLTKGLVEFRQGHFPAAAEWAEKALDSPSLHFHHALASMVLAMSRHELGEPEAARAAFDQGSEYIRAHIPRLDADEMGPNWIDPIIAYALEREAQAMLGLDEQ